MSRANSTEPPVPSPNISLCNCSAKTEDSTGNGVNIEPNPRISHGISKVKFDGPLLVSRPTFANNLLAGVGFLELANAGDFAANVWNSTPIPKFAKGLMALGGSLALLVSYFAAKDAILSKRNLSLLRGERQDLRAELYRRMEEGVDSQDVEAHLDVLRREMATEAISRFGMDIFMGGGSILIAAGTFLAIGGANRRVWLASNYLSGYVGNAPLALYSLCNFFWMSRLFIIACHHGRAGRNLPSGSTAATVLARRVRHVQFFATASGLTNLLGGAGSLATATHWWGYVILIPVIISSIILNYCWRHFLGYQRATFSSTLSTCMDQASLISEVTQIESIKQHLRTWTLDASLLDTTSLTSTLSFIVSNNLFEPFCARLANQHLSLVQDLQSPTGELSLDALLCADESSVAQILDVAHTTLRQDGSQYLQHRLHFLSELLGSYLSISKHKHRDSPAETKEGGGGV